MNFSAKYWIEKLNLLSHPEGGFYKETYRAKENILSDHLPKRFPGNRSFSTGIYYLLEKEKFSAFHKIKSDEMWHHYDGCALIIHTIDQQGTYQTLKLGKNLDQNEMPQAVVPYGVWFAAELEDKSSYALVGCTVSPGFDFSDFEMADQSELLKGYPQHQEIIKKLTRNYIH